MSVVVVSQHWLAPRHELSFVSRALAGVASRLAPVSVLVDGPLGQRRADGAFDLVTMGVSPSPRLPADLALGGHDVLVDDLSSEVADLLAASDPRAVLYLDSSGEHPAAWRQLSVARPNPHDDVVHVPVPVNDLAHVHRHHGFGFTDYQLVLAGPADGEYPDEAAWLSAAFMDDDLVVVHDAKATAWKGRAKRGVVSVDTRMDLWRLMAHARLCIDLSPGSHLARECVEALRLGTPIVVPAGSPAALEHALAGGGAAFHDPGDLIAAVEQLRPAAARASASQRGQAYADARYGDAALACGQLARILGATP